MNRGIYSTATGMVAAQRWMDVTANNLANASTNGFKRDGLLFNDAMQRQLSANGGLGASLGSIGTGAVPQAEYTVFERGSLSMTSNPLDLALDSDKGMFAVQTGGDSSTIKYTRDGTFSLNVDGQIVNKSGFPVLNDRLQPITVKPGKIDVATDGSISIDGKILDKVGVFDGTFTKVGDNLFGADDAKAVDNVPILSQRVEGSNVNAVDAMISMITLSRSFEMAQKSITQQDDLTQRLIQSLSEH